MKENNKPKKEIKNYQLNVTQYLSKLKNYIDKIFEWRLKC